MSIRELLPLGVLLKNKLKSHVKTQEIFDKIFEIVSSISSVDTLKHHPEIELLTCTLVEYFIPKNKDNVNKKELVVQILDKLFSLSDEETELLNKRIQFLYDNNLIKKVPLYKYVLLFTKDYLINIFRIKSSAK